jgi:hypothetical protein
MAFRPPSGGGGGGSGTVTDVSVVSANGLAGTVANATTSPDITLTTTVTGVLKGNGTAISAAVADTDYIAPNGDGSALTGITGGQVANTPAGGIAATDVQAAINELDTEKAALSGAAFTGDVSTTGKITAGSTTSPGGVETIGEGITTSMAIGATAQTSRTYRSRIGNAEINFEVNHLHSTTTPVTAVHARANTDTTTHAAVTNGQVIRRDTYAGRAATSYYKAAEVDVGVDDTGTISDTSMPGKIVHKITPDGSVTPEAWLTVTNDKKATFTGDVALGTNNLTLTGSVGATGARATKVWATDIESTNMPTVGGTSLSSTFSPIAGSASITTLGTVTTGTLSTGAVIGGVTMTLGTDGTGDIYYRNAGGVLTRLGVGSDGDVLTLASGLPSWAAGGGGGLSWGASINGATGTGLALTMDNSYASGGIGQSITIGNTQTQNLTALSIDVGVDAAASARAHKAVDIINRTTDGKGININAFGGATQILGSGGTRGFGIYAGENFNTSSAYSYIHQSIINENNSGAGKNTGLFVDNKSTEFSASSIYSGGGIEVYQRGVGGTAYSLFTANNVNSSTNGLVNYTLSNTQSGASVVQKIDTGTSAQGHVGLNVVFANASSSARGIKIDPGSTGTGQGIEIASRGASGFRGISWTQGIGTSTGIGYGIYQGTISNDSSGYGIYQDIINTQTGTGYGWYVANLGTGNQGVAGRYFSLNNNQSGSLSQNRTADTAEILFSRTNTATSGTRADNFNIAYFRRTSVQNGAGGTFTAAGSVLKLENVATQTAGTLTDSVAVLSLVQSDNSTGGHILFNAYSGTPTANGTLWYDGTNIKYIDGTGTTKTITVT